MDIEPQSGEMAHRIYDVLVSEGGAVELHRDDFKRWFLSGIGREFRFKGNLGFGGKFWRSTNGWHVSCYGEDETPGRLTLVVTLGDQLDALWREYTNADKQDE